MTSHIHIPEVSPVAQAMADGAKSVFSFPFPIFKASDIEVRANSTLLTSGYSVVGEGSSTGGAVIFTAAPANGVRITLRRKQTYARTDDFLDERAPTPHELNDAVDQNVAAIQELAEQTSRAVTRPLSADLSQPLDLSLPNPEAGKVIGWNGQANGLVNLDTQADIPVGKVQVDANDTPGYLDAKLEAGDHIAITKNAASMTIAVTGLGSAAYKDVGTAANQVVQLDASGKVPAAVLPAESGMVKVDGADAADYLENQFQSGSNISVTKNAGKMKIDVTGLGSAAYKDAGTAANQVVQLDASGKVPAAVLPAESGMVKVDSADAADYLENQIQSGSNISVTNNAGKMKIDVTGLGSAADKNIGTSGANVPLLSTANTYGAPQTPAAQVLTDAATVSIAITAQVWTLSTAAARTIGAPTGGVANTFYFLEIASNGFTPSWASAFDFGAAGAPTSLSGTCGFDIFYDGTKYRISTRFTGGV